MTASRDNPGHSRAKEPLNASCHELAENDANAGGCIPGPAYASQVQLGRPLN